MGVGMWILGGWVCGWVWVIFMYKPDSGLRPVNVILKKPVKVNECHLGLTSTFRTSFYGTRI